MSAQLSKSKKCVSCKRRKTRNDFNKNKTKADGLSNTCFLCNRKRLKLYYRNNKDRLVAAVTIRGREIRERNRRRILNYLLEHPCVDCGETDPIVLDFDHISGKKKANVSKLANVGSRSWNAILEEIGKCEIRCANCHRKKTARSLMYFKWLNRAI